MDACVPGEKGLLDMCVSLASFLIGVQNDEETSTQGWRHNAPTSDVTSLLLCRRDDVRHRKEQKGHIVPVARTVGDSPVLKYLAPQLFLIFMIACSIANVFQLSLN